MSQTGLARIQAVKLIRCKPPKNQRYPRAVSNLRTSSYGAVFDGRSRWFQTPMSCRRISGQNVRKSRRKGIATRNSTGPPEGRPRLDRLPTAISRLFFQKFAESVTLNRKLVATSRLKGGQVAHPLASHRAQAVPRPYCRRASSDGM
jgi:hypothetical protein